MTTPHKHAALIKQWADGAIIQWRGGVDDAWHEMGKDGSFTWANYIEYRVKPPQPEVVKYKRYLSRMGDSMRVRSIDPGEQKVFPREETSLFIRWIDTEWQEVEV